MKTEFEELLEKRQDVLFEELKEMEKTCKEQQEKVGENITETVKSVYALSKEVNGKLANVYQEINKLGILIEQVFSKQKSYVIGVLVSVLIMLLASLGSLAYNIVYNRIDVDKIEKLMDKKVDVSENNTVLLTEVLLQMKKVSDDKIISDKRILNEKRNKKD